MPARKLEIGDKLIALDGTEYTIEAFEIGLVKASTPTGYSVSGFPPPNHKWTRGVHMTMKAAREMRKRWLKAQEARK